jgi:hypothetical protein
LGNGEALKKLMEKDNERYERENGEKGQIE